MGIKGLLRWRNGVTSLQAESSRQTIDELEAMTSPIKAFIADRCEITLNARILVADLFNAWRDSCNVNGHQHTGNVQWFGKNLRAAFPEIQMDRPQESLRRERCYIGIKFT